MIRILSTEGLAAQIRTIISEASKIVVLVSPFLDEKSNIYDYLHNLREKAYKVPVFIITRTPAQANVKNQTNAIKNCAKYKIVLYITALICIQNVTLMNVIWLLLH